MSALTVKRIPVLLVLGLAGMLSANAQAVQYARPDATNDAAGWSAVNAATHHDAVNEVTPDDNDYVNSTNGNNTTIILSLNGVTDPGGANLDDHILRYRCRSSGTGGPERCNAALYQGTTEIANNGNNSATRNNFSLVEFVIPDASTITDYTNLNVHITASSLGGNENIDISWVELEVPDASISAPTVTTPTFTGITASSATLGGNITSDGGAPLTSRGTVWDTASGPTTQNSLAEGGTATGIFSHLRTGLNTGTRIYFRAYATNSSGTGYTADGAFYTEPANSPAALNIDTVTENSFQVTWPANPAGDGDGAIIVVREASAVTASPTDGTEHTANSVFGSGEDLGTQQYVVYRGAGTAVTVTGLTPDTVYHVAAFYYAGTGTGASGINYRQTSPTVKSQTTNPAASLPTLDQSTFSAVGSSSATLGGNITTDGGSTLLARGTMWNTAGSPITQNAQAEGGTALGSFSHARTGLDSGTLIWFRSYATNASGAGYGPDNSFYTEPLNSPVLVSIDAVTTNSFRVTWPANPAGDGDGAIIVVRETSAVTASPTDGTEHTANSVFGSGEDLGTQQYVVYRGAGTEVTVTGLADDTTYHVAAYYYAGSGTGPSGINYRQSSPATHSQATDPAAAVPTLDQSTFSAVGSSSATLGGNITTDGGSTLLARGTMWNTAGSPITQNAQAEGGTALGSFSHARTGLDSGTLIWFRSYATNASGTGYGPDNSFYTEPLNSPASATIGTVTSSSFQVSWPANPAGDGDGALVVVREGSSVTATPTDGVEHVANAVFGSGADIGSLEYVVYRGAGNSVSVSGLSPETSYHVAVFYSAGTGSGAGGINYRQSSPALNSQLTDAASNEPTVQASNIVMSTVATKAIRFQWTPGNGDGSIATIRTQGTSRVPPLDFTEYTADPDFTLAPETSGGSGNFVVYSGNRSAVTVYNLTQNVTYVITVYAWGGAGSSTDYLTVNPPEVNQATDGPAMHNYDNIADCTDCHNNHGNTGEFIPHDTIQEGVCVSCHQATGPASNKLDFALHLTPSYAAPDVDCGSCHEVHKINPGSNNTTLSTNPVSTATDYNLKFVRANVDKWVPTATSDDAVFQVSPDDLAFEDGTATTSRGICQSCHTEASNHRWDGTGDQCHNGQGGNCGPAHTDCLVCHTHTGNFAATGGGCTGCHSGPQPPSAPTRREIVSEFARESSHVADTSLTDDDCQVCHAQDVAGHLHGGEGGTDYQVTLFDADDHNTYYSLGSYADPFTDRTEAAKLTTFCLSCHDSDGAQAEATPASPFTGSIAPRDIASNWPSSSHATISQQASPDGSGNPTTCFGNGEFGCHASGHGSEKVTLLAPDGAAATSPDFSEQREGFCLNCHVANGASSIDINQYFAGLATDFRVTAGAQYTTVNQKHDVLPADQTFSSAVVTCKDCHDPHIATDVNPAIDPDTGTPLATYQWNGTYSGDSTSFTYNWDANDFDPTNPNGGQTSTGWPTDGPYPEPDYVGFCLTCHDGTAPPGVIMPPSTSTLLNMADSYRIDDQHGRLVGNGSASRGYMKQPWSTATEYAAEAQNAQAYASLNCTTCHSPHGTGNIYHLRNSITVAGQAMTVGGKDAFQDPATCTRQCDSILNALPEFGSSTYTLPLNAGGQQEDMGWGAWCTFCHEPSHGTSTGLACQSGHRHGGGNF